MGLFDSVLKIKADAQTKLDGTRREIHELQRKRAAVFAQPATRQDVKDALAAHVAKLGSGYRDALVGIIASMATRPAGPADVLHQHHTLVGLADPHSPNMSPLALDAALATLFAKTLTEAIGALVDEVEWPGKEGQPRAKREAEVERINARIDVLQAEELAVINQAAEAGIALADTP